MKKILVIDDSPTEVHQLKKVLETNNFSVDVASNGIDGLKSAEIISPDLIIMDVVMPGVNGFQATRQLSRNPKTKGIPVVIVSSKDQDTDKVWGMRQGARAYLVKPVSEKDLLDAVATALQ